MPNYDPTSPKVSDDFIAQDGEADVQGHIYRNEDDARTESRPDGILARPDEFMAMAVPEDEDVQGHLGAAVARDLGAAVPSDEDADGFVPKQASPESGEDEFRAAF